MYRFKDHSFLGSLCRHQTAVRVALAAAAVAVAAAPAGAATITWTTGSAMAADGTSLATAAGTQNLLAAVNFTNTGSTSVINGISFSAFNYDSSITSPTYWSFTTAGGSGLDTGLVTNPSETFYTGTSFAMFPLLNAGIYMFTDSGRTYNNTFTMKGLTIGNTYSTQFVFLSANQRSAQMTSGTTGGSLNSPTVNMGGNLGASSITATWTADATSQDFWQIAHSGIMSGFTLIETPPAPLTPTWTGATDADWGTAGNWTTGTVPNAVSAAVILGNTSSLATIDLGASNITLGGMTFSSGTSVTLQSTGGGGLILNNAGAGTVTVDAGRSHVISAPVQLASGGASVTVSSAADSLTLSGPLTGTAGLTNAGPGALTISGSVNYSGALANTSTGTVTVSGPVTNVGNITLNGGGRIALSGSVTSAGAISNSGAGLVAMSSGLGTAGTVTNSQGGSITVAGGSVTTVGNVTNSLSGTVSFSGDVGAAGAIANSGAGRLSFGGSLGTAGAISNASSGTLAIVGGVTSATTISNSAAGVISVGGNVASVGAVTNAGAGSLTVGGNLASSGAIANSGGGTLTISGNLTSATSLTNSSGTTVLPGNNTFSGPTSVTGGKIQVNSANALQNSAVTLAAANGLVFGSSAATFGSLAGAGGSAALSNGGSPVALTVGGDNTSTVFGGVLSGAGSLTKVGSGTMSIGAAQTFTGDTNIDAGAIKLMSIVPELQPTGLNVGDKYRLVFVTSGSIYGRNSSGGPSSISGYNDFVTAQAGLSADTAALGTSWSAIVSFRASNGTLTAATANTSSAAGTGVPVYNTNGEIVASTYTQLWSSATPALTNAIKYTQYGVATTGSFVWTGMAAGGAGDADRSLGYPTGGYINGGDPNSANTVWATQLWPFGDPNSVSASQFPIYAMSGTLTAVAGGSPLPTATALRIGSGATLDLNGIGQQVAALSDRTGGGTITNSAVGTASTLTVNLTGGTSTFSGVIDGAGEIINFVKSGAGKQVLSGANTYLGTTTVSGGLLSVGGSLTSASVVVASNAELGGTGVLSAGVLSGGGVIGPGDSPGILTAVSVDPSGGLSWAFELTGTGSPSYSTASASINDVLRLTGPSPFASALSALNVIDVYFSGEPNGTYRGGFYADSGDFSSNLTSATFRYWVSGTGGGAEQFYNGVGYYSLATYNPDASVTQSVVAESADFGGGAVNGYVTQFVIVAVPEPATLALAVMGIGGLLVAARRRRRG